MRLRNYMTEVFTSKVPVKVLWNSKDVWNAEFDVSGVKYYVYFTRYIMDGENNSWGLSFEKQQIDKDVSAFGVFSGVIAAFKMFLKEKKPVNLFFDSSDKSLKRIYDKFVPHIEKMGYRRDKKAVSHEYYFERKK